MQHAACSTCSSFLWSCLLADQRGGEEEEWEGKLVACAYKTLNRNFNNLLCSFACCSQHNNEQQRTTTSNNYNNNKRRSTTTSYSHNNWFIKKISMRRRRCQSPKGNACRGRRLSSSQKKLSAELWGRGVGRAESGEGVGMGEDWAASACQTTCQQQWRWRRRRRRSLPIRRFHIFLYLFLFLLYLYFLLLPQCNSIRQPDVIGQLAARQKGQMCSLAAQRNDSFIADSFCCAFGLSVWKFH